MNYQLIINQPLKSKAGDATTNTKSMSF